MAVESDRSFAAVSAGTPSGRGDDSGAGDASVGHRVVERPDPLDVPLEG